MDHHDVLAVTPADAARGTITLYRFLNAHTATWRYAFEAGQRLRLTSMDGTVFQLFEQRPWYIPDSAVTAPAAPAAESPLGLELAAV
jgi:FtsP/CotA-like multicopper oxidase with cupredoxin domain